MLPVVATPIAKMLPFKQLIFNDVADVATFQLIYFLSHLSVRFCKDEHRLGIKQAFTTSAYQAMQRVLTILFVIMFSCVAFAARADVCAICGEEIHGTIYMVTDRVTGEQVEVCSNCMQLPRCFICGLPVKDGVKLPDGRWLCARDAKTAMLNPDDILHTFSDVQDDLNKMFSRYTSFPTNVDVSVIDQIDVDEVMGSGNGSVENSDVLGYTQGSQTDGQTRYKIGLLTGQSQAQLEEVCAHELSHAWVGENVTPERHAQIQRDTEEGFCEMMGYLYVDSKGEEQEKKRVLANAYTRGQVQLFIEAEQQYGFDEILDWMQHGVTGRLEEGHLDEIRDVKMPASGNAPSPDVFTAKASLPPPAPATIQLQGIMWGGMPSAIINGQSFFAGDELNVRVGQAKVLIRCISIGKNTVRIKNAETGKEQDLRLAGK
jgi:hypothetical protein